MTSLFDFVRRVVPLSADLGFADIVEDVLKECLTKNTNKNFRAWFDGVTWGEIYMDLDIDDLDRLFDTIRDLDHTYHHKIWSGTAYRILNQFHNMFRSFTEGFNRIVFEDRFRTLRKHVPSIKDYMQRYYKPPDRGLYILKEEYRDVKKEG
jgi:hypothetical protein